MFRKVIALLLVICSLSCFPACSSIDPQKEKSINFDLSQYKNHGDLSCGLIWVTKEISDWNKEQETKFAYLDINGVVKSPWFSLNTYRDAKDFSNGYVILIENSEFKKYSHSSISYSNCAVYNTKFDRIAYLNCRIGGLSDDYFAYITEFDSQGYAYALGYDHQIEDDVLYWIDSSGFHKFENSENFSLSIIDNYDLKRFRISNDYFVLVSGSSDPKYLYTVIACIYDKSGKLVLDIRAEMYKHIEDFAITSAEVVGEDTVKFYFYGLNQKRYVCIMNFDGEFIQSPKEV